MKPDYVFLFTIKPVIYGAFAAKLLKITAIVTITGLGTAFLSNNWLKRFVKSLYRHSLSSVFMAVFQNIDDRKVFVCNKLIDPSRCILVPGSGIDMNKYCESEFPSNNETTFLLVARMIRDKGIDEFVKAAKIVKSKSPNTRFQLLGPLGIRNRTSIAEKTIMNWHNEGFVEYLGESDNVQSFIEKVCCVVLPSYREGISRVLLEGAAMCRPLIASDVPGCREVVSDGVTGFLCKPKDHFSLAEMMLNFDSLSYEDRAEMGLRGRKKVTEEFSQDIVCDLYFSLIKEKDE